MPFQNNSPSTLMYLFRKKKKHMHIAFRIPISEYESCDRLIDFISNEWKKRKIFLEDSKMIYPCLISSMKWKFGCLFESKTKNGKQRLRKNV